MGNKSLKMWRKQNKGAKNYTYLTTPKKEQKLSNTQQTIKARKVQSV